MNTLFHHPAAIDATPASNCSDHIYTQEIAKPGSGCPGALSYVNAFRQSVRIIVATVFCTLISSCELVAKKDSSIPPVADSKPALAKTYSPLPIKGASKESILLAQFSLQRLGYSIGRVDGIWGPRSAREIQKFEQDKNIASANGFLSELNLHRLKEVSGNENLPDNFKPVPLPATIAQKLTAEEASSTTPQLVFVDRNYELFAKPNPYSEKLDTIRPGSGIYILRIGEGWYEIESENKQRGYLMIN